MDQIAVLFNEKFEIATIEDLTKLVVFEKNEQGWLDIKNIFTSIDVSQDLSAVRQKLQQLANELEGCKIIVGKAISGVFYRTFDKMGFEIFEIDTFAQCILDELLSDVKNTSAVVQQENSLLNINPIETSIPGVYFFDLIALQKQNAEISSKKALQPFLNKTPFVRLDIVCGHIPPWIEKLAQDKKVGLEVEKIEEQKVKVSITKACCI